MSNDIKQIRYLTVWILVAVIALSTLCSCSNKKKAVSDNSGTAVSSNMNEVENGDELPVTSDEASSLASAWGAVQSQTNGSTDNNGNNGSAATSGKSNNSSNQTVSQPNGDASSNNPSNGTSNGSSNDTSNETPGTPSTENDGAVTDNSSGMLF